MGTDLIAIGIALDSRDALTEETPARPNAGRLQSW